MKKKQKTNPQPQNYPFNPKTGEHQLEIYAQAEQKESMSIMQRLLKDRIIFLNGQVDGNTVNYVVPCLFHLESLDPEADILLYINS